MLNTEVLWNKALTDNNVRGIIFWLRSLTTTGVLFLTADGDVEESFVSFSCWLQRSAELTKKELLSVCFGQSQGLWMFLDQSPFTKVHVLIQKLKNLLSLTHLEKTLYPGKRLTCRVCHVGASKMVRCGCCSQDHHMLRPYILLGRLVQWWSFTGLLPQYPDAHDLKQISQMWRDMDQNHNTACLQLRCDAEDKYRWSSIIQSIVAYLDKQHGPLWVSEDCAYQTYPPPSLPALLKLVVVPYIDITCVQAIIMYFVLDVSKFLHCKDDLLESFCLTFSVSSNLSQQIRGFWLLDHGFVSDSMEILLSLRSSSAWLSFHHRVVLRILLRKGERQSAMKYLYYTMPAIENIQDARLYMDVLLQNNRISEAWALLRQGQPGNEFLVKHFIGGCENLSLSGEALAIILKDMLHLQSIERPNLSKPDRKNQENLGEISGHFRPLSALLYHGLSGCALSSGDFVRLLGETVKDLNSLKKPTREVVVWPAYQEISKENENVSLSSQISHHIPCSPTLEKLQKKPQRHSEQRLVEDDLYQVPPMAEVVCKQQTSSLEVFSSRCSPSVFSSASTSPDSMASTESFTSAPSSPPAVRTSSRRGSILLLHNQFAVQRDEDCCTPEDDHVVPRDPVLCCPDLTLTLEGATEPVSIKSLSRDSMEKLIVSKCGVKDFLTCAVSVNISEPTNNDTVEITQPEKRSKSRFNLPLQCYSNEDNQAVPSTAEIPVDSHNFLMPECEKLGYDKGVSEDIIRAENVTEHFSSVSPEQKDEVAYHQNPISSPSESSNFLELKPLRRALSVTPVEEYLAVFCRDSQDAVDQPEILTSCALNETMQDFLGQIHEQDLSLKEEEPSHPSSLASLRNSILEIDLNPKRRGSRPHQVHIPFGASLSPHTSPICCPQISSSEQVTDKSPGEGRASATKEAVCFRTSSDRVGHCKLGSWWKQALETRRPSTGLLPAIEQIPAATKEKRVSPGLGKPQCCGVNSFQESSAKPKGPKGEIKQGANEETNRRRGSSRASQMAHGVATHRRLRGKRNKRVKRA